jgi:hypothetical protein
MLKLKLKDGSKVDSVELKDLADVIAQSLISVSQKNDPSSTTPNVQTLNGPFPGNSAQFGLFSQAGVRPDRFSALPRPRSAFEIIRFEKSVYTNELLEIMTGQTDGSGNNVTGWCGDAPKPGNLKVMAVNYVFGKMKMSTNIIALQDVGELRNRADVPGELINLAVANNPLIPDIAARIDDSQSILRAEFYRLGVEIERRTEKVLWDGNTATSSSSTQRGWWREFMGFSNLVKTGYVDNTSGYAAAAVDSIVVPFTAAVTGNAADGSSRNIYQVFSDVFYALMDRAETAGIECTWAIVMRKDQFRQVTRQIAAQIAPAWITNTNAGQPQNQDGQRLEELRQSMFNGQYLYIDGMQVPVVFSDGISRQVIGNNNFNADIFILPVRTSAGFPLIRGEYFDMGNQYIAELTGQVGEVPAVPINNGMYLMGRRDNPSCLEYELSAKMRVILETPFLAARIDDVQYTFYAQQRDAYVGDSFYSNGGISYRT